MKRPLMVTGTLLAASMVTVMSGAIIAPSLPAIAAYFEGSQNSALMASYILVMPALGVVLFAPVVGWAADRFGSWGVLAVSVLVLMASGVSGAWSTGYASLLAGRFILGVAIAGVSTSATSLLGSLPEEGKRQELLGKQSAFINMAGMTYTLAGGLLAAVHWRIPFFLYLWPVVLLPFVQISMKAHPTAVGPASQAPQGEFKEFLRSKSLPVAAFVWILGCLSLAMIYTLFTVHPFRMQELGIEDPRLFSLTIVAATASSALTGWNLKRLSKMVGPHMVFALTFFMFGSGFLVISYAQELWHIVIGNLLLGIGMGLPVPSGAAWLSRISPAAVRGRVLGIFNTFIFLGQFLSPLMIRGMEFFTSYVFQTYLMLSITCLVLSGLLVAAAKTHLISPRVELKGLS